MLSLELVDDLRRLNPWWEGKPMPSLPRTRRHLVDQIHRRLELRLAPVVAVRGPRRIGKATAQLQVPISPALALTGSGTGPGCFL